jgi:hypothetical protein
LEILHAGAISRHGITMHSMRFAIYLSAFLLSACASAPTPLRHKLDAKTGSTVNLAAEPVELISAVSGSRTAAFAYLGPFDINRMGAHSLFLWVLVPEDAASSPPALRCGDEPIDLPLLSNGLGALGLSQPPYDPPYPWSRQWYYTLTESALTCLAGAQVIVLEVPATDGATRFTAEAGKGSSGFPVLRNFAAHRDD